MTIANNSANSWSSFKNRSQRENTFKYIVINVKYQNKEFQPANPTCLSDVDRAIAGQATTVRWSLV